MTQIQIFLLWNTKWVLQPSGSQVSLNPQTLGFWPICLCISLFWGCWCLLPPSSSLSSLFRSVSLCTTFRPLLCTVCRDCRGLIRICWLTFANKTFSKPKEKKKQQQPLLIFWPSDFQKNKHFYSPFVSSIYAPHLSLSARPSLTWFVLVLHHFSTPFSLFPLHSYFCFPCLYRAFSNGHHWQWETFFIYNNAWWQGDHISILTIYFYITTGCSMISETESDMEKTMREECKWKSGFDAVVTFIHKEYLWTQRHLKYC